MKRFSRILYVAESGNTDDTGAFNQALTLANNNDARLTVAGVVEKVDENQVQTALIERRREQLDALIEPVSKPEKLTIKILMGKPFVEIIREVIRNDHDLVIKSVASTTNKMGYRRFGSTDMKLMRKCPCPIWMIKSTRKKAYREVLASVDDDWDDPGASALNRKILEMATSLAISNSSELHVVHAWEFAHESLHRSPWLNYTDEDVDEMVMEEEATRRKWLEHLVERHCIAIGKDAKIKPRLHLVKGDAADVVSGLANEMGAELVVMGTIGRAGIPGFLIGNTAEGILSQIDSSVLAVKPEGFVSPILLE